MQVTLEHTRQEADNIWTFYFSSEKPVQYTAGQYVELTIPHDNADNRGIDRWFTLSSSPADRLLSITTKFSSDPSSTFKTALRSLKPGDVAEMSTPSGDFVLPKLIQTPLVFVAGGIGITPFHSIIKWLGSTNETRPIKMLYGVHSEEEITFLDELKKAGLSPIVSVSEPSTFWGGERGQLTAELIVGLEQPAENTLFYLSGPESMINKLAIDLKRLGIDSSQIVTDTFPNYTEI